MAREQGCENGVEASLLSRRKYMRATGTLAGFVGIGAISDETAASSSKAIAEGGSVIANHSWKKVQMSNTFSDPVVITGPPSYDGPQPSTSRLHNVSNSGFEIAIEEWTYLDGSHRYETVSYFVTDSGAYHPSNGLNFVAGTVRADHRWNSTSFGSLFSTTPIVFSQVQTVNGPQPVVTRQRNISRTTLDVRVQEEEAQGPHRIEDIGYLAIESGAGTINGQPIEVGVKTSVDHTWKTITFDGTYSQPVFISDLQTYRGSNTCSIRYRNLTDSSVEVKVEEEASKDRETFHLGERVGYLVFEKATETTSEGYGVGGYGTLGFGQ